MVSFHYEYSIISKKHFLLNTNVGLGLNENADDSDPTDRPVYGIHSGLICLAGWKPLFIEVAANPGTYFYKSTTFVNLNGWFGIRVMPKRMEGFFMSVGYTPILYKTFTNAGNHYSDWSVGFKAGVTF